MPACHICPCTAVLKLGGRCQLKEQAEATAAAGPCPLPASADRTLVDNSTASRQQQCTTQSRRTKPSRVETSRVELLGIEYPVARGAQSTQIKLHTHRANLHAARRATVTSTDYRRLTSLFEAMAAAFLMPTRLLASHCL